eukprot:9077963-Pyramimonas_sp.AAC.1
MGLAGWASRWNPCQLCMATMEEWGNCIGHLSRPPRAMRGHAHRDQGCRACEVEVRLETHSHMEDLLRSLRWLNLPKKIGGRLILHDTTVNGVALIAGDRVTPSASLMDVTDMF